MWMITVFSIAFGKWNNRKNWLDDMIAECPNPKLMNKIAKVFWFYSCLFFGLALVLPELGGFWIGYVKAAGIPGFFMAFYGAGFLCALANWGKCDPSRLQN